jgi:hypothetical protein
MKLHEMGGDGERGNAHKICIIIIVIIIIIIIPIL